VNSYRTSARNPCPVCGRTKDGDCAVDEVESGFKVRCHTHLGDAGIEGFVYRGQTECGMWGLYYSVVEDSSDRPKAIRAKGIQEFFYPNIKGDPLAKVVRTDDGKGIKKFAQWHRIHGKGVIWALGLPEKLQKQVHLYRIGDEVNKGAIANHEPILIVEGEGKADLLLSMGIAATCAIGGAGKWRRYGYPNYLEDLQGASLVLVPDRDTKGLEHMSDVEKDFPNAQWLYPYSDSPLWNRLPEKGGLDIADWIEDFKLSKEQIMDAVGKVPLPPKVTNPHELNEQEDNDILKSETQTLLGWVSESISIESLIPSLTNPFTQVARAFNIPEVVLVSALLPIAASLLRVGTKIEIAAATEFYPPPIIWTGIIAESGATKSPIFKILTKPLKVLQAEAEEDYKAKLKTYDLLLEKYESAKDKGEKPEKPIPRNYFFQDFTTEGLALSLEGTTHGTMIAVDELAEMLAGFNQYKGGKGNDRQKWLTIYDSGGMKVDRSSGKRMFLTHTPVSILGTIQPDVLKQQMGDLYTVDGLWQRFLWVNLPVTRLPAPNNGVTCNISELLLGIYRRLENLPAIAYGISSEARKLWSRWHDWCETQKLAEAHPSIRTLYPKARERAARIALVFHIVEAIAKGQMPSQEISADTLNAAIQFVQWTIKQTRLLYADLGITEHQDSAKITRFVERFRHAEWVTPRMVRTWTAARDKPSSEKCREFMQQIVGMGYATNNGETGREFKIKILSISPLSPLGTQTHTQYTSERSPLSSPDVVHLVHFEQDRRGQNLAVLEADIPVKPTFHPNNLDLSITEVFASSNSPDPTGSDEVKDKLSSSPEVDYVDYKWTTKWTTPKPSPDEALNPKWTKWTTSVEISVGDRVHYRGKGENGLFTLKGLKTDELTVVAIAGDMVEVSSPRWLTTQNIPAKDLEKI
jgi:hypothetical protein